MRAAASAVCGSRCVTQASNLLLLLQTNVCRAEILHALRRSLTFFSKPLRQDIHHQHAATNAAALHANRAKSLESAKQLARTAATCASCAAAFAICGFRCIAQGSYSLLRLRINATKQPPPDNRRYSPRAMPVPHPSLKIISRCQQSRTRSEKCSAAARQPC